MDAEKSVVQKTKSELFAENPDRFVDSHDLIIALMRTEKGPAMLVSPRGRAEAIMAKGECDIALTEIIMAWDNEHAKSKIIQPKGGILNFARRR